MSSLRQAYGEVALPNSRPFSRNLTLDGSAGGQASMAFDYSDTGLGETDYFTKPDPNFDLQIEEISLIVSDNGTPGLDEFGNLGSALTNGLRFFVIQRGTRIYAQTEIFANQDIVRTEDRLSITQWTGTVRVINYSKQYFSFSDGEPIHDRHNEFFGVTLNDDFSSLVEFSMHVNGGQTLSQVV